MLVEPPRRIPWYLRPGLWIAARIAGGEPVPTRLLAHAPKLAVGAGIFEALAAGPAEVEPRLLALARIAASVSCGCPCCVDMNAATWKRAGLSAGELNALLKEGDVGFLGDRERLAAEYARVLSRTPICLDGDLSKALLKVFQPRELVVLAATIAQVNYWSWFNQGLGVPSVRFFDPALCKVE